MRKYIKIIAKVDLLNDIISQIKKLNQEEEKQIKFLGKNKFSMIGMEYYKSSPNPVRDDESYELIIEAENPILFYKLGLYTAPLIKRLFK